MKVRIKRQTSPQSRPYWQTFLYDGPTADVTVSAVLDRLNYTDDLFDAEGRPAPRIRWECSCLQTVCGGCAMVINGTPALACSTFLKDLRGKELVLEPLSKFPVVADLIVDRSIIYETLRRAEAYLEQHSAYDEKTYAHQYSVGKCLKCGLCLEACPNYHGGTEFFGPLYANEAYVLYAQDEGRKQEHLQTYQTHFSSLCSKSLSCQAVCPAGIETLTSILEMNRHRFEP